MDFVLCGPTSLTISSCVEAHLHCIHQIRTWMEPFVLSWHACFFTCPGRLWIWTISSSTTRTVGGRLVEAVWGRPPKPNMKHNFERWGKIVAPQAARLLRCQVWDVAGPPWKSPSLICSKQSECERTSQCQEVATPTGDKTRSYHKRVLQCRRFYQVVIWYRLAEHHSLYAQLTLAKTHTAVQ